MPRRKLGKSRQGPDGVVRVFMLCHNIRENSLCNVSAHGLR